MPTKKPTKKTVAKKPTKKAAKKPHNCGICSRCRERVGLEMDLKNLQRRRKLLDQDEAELIEKLARQKCKPTGDRTEKLLLRARAFLKGKSRDRDLALLIHKELVATLPSLDLFWPTWRFGLSRKSL